MSSEARDPELAFLLQAIKTVSAGETGGGALQELVQLVRDHYGAEAVSIARIEPDGAVVFCAASGGSAERIVGLRLATETGIVGWVAANAEPLWIPDVAVDARFYPRVDRHTGFKTESILAMPLMARGKVFGVLEFINPAPGTDIAGVGDLVESIALLAAPIIQSAGLTERLRSVEARYQRLFDLNLDPLAVLSAEGRLLEVNNAAQTMLSLSVDEPPEQNLARMGIEASVFRELRRQARHLGVVAWEFRAAEQGRVLQVRLMHLPSYRPHGGYMWLGHDITDQVDQARAQQELMQMIVHDLRSPLGSIQNSMELVLAAWREQDATMPVEQVLGIGLRMARRMEQLISDILDSARLSANERSLELAEIDVREMVDEAVETIISSAHRRDQTITTQIAPEVETLNGDIDLLRRVMVNLLTNAVKYSQDGGKIQVKASVNDEEMLFYVMDDGPGVAPEIRDQVFKLFVRGGPRRVKGTGIGLAFCKLAVEAHGGRIWLETNAEQGATFAFAIPKMLPVLPRVPERTSDDTPTLLL